MWIRGVLCTPVQCDKLDILARPWCACSAKTPRMIPCNALHKKKILLGICSFHRMSHTGFIFDVSVGALLNLEPNWYSHSIYYAKRTEKLWDFVAFQAMKSSWSWFDNGILLINVSSHRPVTKSISSSIVLRRTFPLCVIIYLEWLSDIQWSFQIFICVPIPTLQMWLLLKVWKPATILCQVNVDPFLGHALRRLPSG